MIDKFKKNHWYRFNGKSVSPLMTHLKKPLLNFNGHMDFMLDGKWNQCKNHGINNNFAAFYDSSEPDMLWPWGDPTIRDNQLYMFDELSPAMYNIKKLKNQLDKD